MPKEVCKRQNKKQYLTAGNLVAEKEDDFTRLRAVTNQA